MTPVSPRPIAADELAVIDAAYPEFESRHLHRFRHQQEGLGTYLIAWEGDVPVGWVYVRSTRQASPRARGGAEVIDLQVAERYRRRGHGRALLDAAEQTALADGCTTIGLSVTVDNPHNDLARAMYLRSGYAESGEGPYDDGYHYHDAEGVRRYHGEPHLYLVKRLRAGAEG